MSPINLPIDNYLKEIQTQLQKNNAIVLTAEPGAGKTTRVPPALLEIFKGQIWMLEPRRIAAIAAAQRIAVEQDWSLGQEVGYQVRLENKTTEQTRLKIVTEAILNKKIAAEPQLTGIDLVILDEFHERSLHADLALGLLKETQMLYRPDLKILIMSATLDTEKISHFLDQAPILKIPGRLFPIQTFNIKESQLLLSNRQQIHELAQRIRKAYEQSQTQSTALVFLPGVPEIQMVFDLLMPWAQGLKLELQTLHGSLDLDQQRKVLTPHPGPRMVLSTNIAETSLTIDGVDVVIDSGLLKLASLDLKTGFTRLEIKRISKASAQQRQGRSGRQSPGKCFKLWNTLDELSLPAFEKPEIQRADLAETLLLLSSLGQNNFSAFSWFEKPSEHQLRQSWDLLYQLKMISVDSKITELGKIIMKIPLPLRPARILVAAHEAEQPEVGCELAALLIEKDFLKNSAEYVSLDTESDLYLRWWILKNEPERIPQHQRSNLKKTIAQLRGIHLVSQKKMNLVFKSQNSLCSYLIFKAYTDRLCKRRSPNSRMALMVGRRGVQLSENSAVQKSLFFVAIDGMGPSQGGDLQVNLASQVEEFWIYDSFKDEIKVSIRFDFDLDKKKFYVIKQNDFRGLPLKEPTLEPCSLEEVTRNLPIVVFNNWDYFKKENTSLKRFFERWEYLTHTNNGPLEDYPPFTDELLESLIQQACWGETSFSNCLEKDWTYFLESLLKGPSQKALDTLPDKIQVPSGSWISVIYPKQGDNKPPYIAVRLQEIFGWTTTPKVGPHQVPLVIHLLAPNYRPVQVTQDLESFWSHGYIDVKKELRLKYPKHSWPEDPKTAPAIAKGRRRESY